MSRTKPMTLCRRSRSRFKCQNNVVFTLVWAIARYWCILMLDRNVRSTCWDCNFAIYRLFLYNFAEILNLINKHVAYTVKVTHQCLLCQKVAIYTLSGLLEAKGQRLVITSQFVVVFSYSTGRNVHSDDKVRPILNPWQVTLRSQDWKCFDILARHVTPVI